MKLSAAYGADKFGLSFELFPPKTPKSEEELFRQVRELMQFRPSYVTCTYGAGGSTRQKTLDVVTRVKQEHGVSVAAHLTCVQSRVEDLRNFLREATERSVDHIVALRGDPPKGETTFQAIEGGLAYANELVSLIRSEFPNFGIAVAGYPETHMEAESPETDLRYLKQKVDAGADVVITQLFYDNEDFFRFRDRCAATGIRVPIVPGVMPILRLAQIQKITSLCKAKLPASLISQLEACGENVEAQTQVGIDFATRQLAELLEAGIPGIHFYVLNKAGPTATIIRSLGGPLAAHSVVTS